MRFGARIELLKLNAFVGNGGLGLRKTQAVRHLLGEFPETLHVWAAVGNPEDLFIALLGGLSKDFRIPNLRKAAASAIELEPDRMLFLNQRELPFRAHQWDNLIHWILTGITIVPLYFEIMTQNLPIQLKPNLRIP